MKKIRFRISVNCSRDVNVPEHYDDCGFIILPDRYSEIGVPTRLVISCHGAGGTVTTDDSQVEHQLMTQYLVANGYAVMDVNGMPEEYAKKMKIDLRNNIGSPIAVRCYVNAYRYCMDHFNLKPEVFVHGGSMGGISSANLVLSKLIPVIAHSAFCPVLDTYNEIFLNPWSDGLPKVALGKLYRLDADKSGDYIYDEEKIEGYNPANTVKSTRYPVPVKFWHCIDDGVVSYDVTHKFVDTVNKNGGIAFLKSLPHGGHEPQLVGPPVKAPYGVTNFDGSALEITPAVDEVLLWIKQFDK